MPSGASARRRRSSQSRASGGTTSAAPGSAGAARPSVAAGSSAGSRGARAARAGPAPTPRAGRARRPRPRAAPAPPATCGRRPGAGRRARSSTTCTRALPTRRSHARQTASRSARAGTSRRSWSCRSHSRQALTPSVKARCVQACAVMVAEVAADDERRAARGRRAGGPGRPAGRGAGRRARGRRPGGSRDATSRRRGRTSGSGRPAATTWSASRLAATRTSSPAGSSAGSTGGGPNADSATAPASSRSGRPRPGGRGGQHGVGQRGAGAAGLVEPAQQLELLGARAGSGRRDSPRRLPTPARASYRRPRRCATQPQARCSPGRARSRGADRAAVAELAEARAERRAAGPAARRPRGSSPAARRPRRRATTRAGTLSGLTYSSSSASGTGRRSSRSPITWMPLPLTHSIQWSACSVAHVEAPGRQQHGRRGAVHEAVLGEQLADQLVVLGLAPGGPVHPAVELPDHLGLGDAERGVEPVAVERRPGGVDAERDAEPAASSSPGSAPRCGTVTRCTRSGGQPALQVPSTVGQVEGAEEPRLAALDPVEEAAVGPLAALLDALLPGGRQLPGRGRGRSRRRAPRSRRGPASPWRSRSGEAGARISWLTMLVPFLLRSRRTSWSQRTVGVAGLPAPVLAEQVERRAELEQLRGDQRRAGRDVDLVLGQRAGVARRGGAAGTSSPSSVHRCAGRRPAAHGAGLRPVSGVGVTRTAAGRSDRHDGRRGSGRPRWPGEPGAGLDQRVRSTPCWMPRPVSIQTRSSVARLPVALLAYGQPPRPPALASNVVMPARSAARVLASAWP